MTCTMAGSSAAPRWFSFQPRLRRCSCWFTSPRRSRGPQSGSAAIRDASALLPAMTAPFAGNTPSALCSRHCEGHACENGPTSVRPLPRDGCDRRTGRDELHYLACHTQAPPYGGKMVRGSAATTAIRPDPELDVIGSQDRCCVAEHLTCTLIRDSRRSGQDHRLWCLDPAHDSR